MRKWKLTDPLLDLTGKGDYWTIADACEGVQVLGGIGSGKTSGALQITAKAFLLNDFGGIVLCAKIDEAETWERYAKETNREKDLIKLSETTFDFLHYESTRTENVEVENICNCFMEVAEVAGEESGGSNEAYWRRAGKQLLRNTISLLLLSEEKITLNNISRLIASAPKSNEECVDKKWQVKSYCYELFQRIVEKQTVKTQLQKHEYDLTVRYLLNEYPSLDSRTRGNIVSFFTTMADSLLRGKINEIFCSGKIDTTPEMCGDGKIILVDLSIKEYQEVGKYAAVIVKYMTQKYLERRKVKKQDYIRPVFIFADESHYFTTSKDQEFQTTARSARGCTVFATQNYPNYLKALNKKATVDSLLGNLQTKIICQNGDNETNKWASEMIGKVLVERNSTNESVQMSVLGGKMSKNKGKSEQKDYILEPIEFTKLPKGGKETNYLVGSVFWRGGKTWKNKSSFLRLKYKQRNQKIRKNTVLSEFRDMIISGISWILLAVFFYYIYKYELNNLITAAHNVMFGVKKIYITGILVGLLGGAGWLLLNNLAYIAVISKLLFVGLLFLLGCFIYEYSTVASLLVLIVNAYLIVYFGYQFLLKDLFTIQKWHTPIIIKQ
ncbi:MAG: TraM recognition domain-containing protein [Lentisphaerae bacterium]|nr:TraM recognition domain-containing protein [Lentisphaerota bacterium]